MIRMKRKSTFYNLFIVLSVLLLALPFLTSLEDLLTRVIIHFNLYDVLQRYVVPYELRVLSTILNLLDLPVRSGKAYIQFVRDGKPEVIFLAWNCIGWQSLVFLLVSLMGGLSGRFTTISRLQAVTIGLLGTYLVNILRLVLVVVVYYIGGRGVGVVFHNYFSNLMAIVWLFVFWWLSYTYVLEEKHSNIKYQIAKIKNTN